MDYFLSAIPLWVYVMVAVMIAVPLFYFFSPVILAIWRITPKPVKYILLGILSLFGMFAYGRHKGYKDVKAREDELNKKAVDNRRQIHDEVEKLNPADTDKRINKWMRD